MAIGNALNIVGTGIVTAGGNGTFTEYPVTNHDVLVGGASNAITSVGPGSAGQVLQSGGASADPAYSTATFPATATGTGTILRADGTNWSATTTTYPNTNAINTLLYASSANVMSALATANSGVLATDASGVPSISATPTVTSIKFGTGTSLANYLEGTFTPGIQFGGGTTGITYSAQQGNYTRIGRVVFVNIYIALSNKGSSTGSAQITGLPLTVGANSQYCFMQSDQLTYPVGDTVLGAQFTSTGTTIDLYGTGTATNNTALANTNFANNTSIRIQSFYFV